MIRRTYTVAGCGFGLVAPDGTDIDALLPSFSEFRCPSHESADGLIFILTLLESCSGLPAPSGVSKLIDETVNDMGHTALYETDDSYIFTIKQTGHRPEHCLRTNKGITYAEALIHWDDPYSGEVISSMLRFLFSQAVLDHGGISIHSSAVLKDGKAWLFMGKSGTGKSTHSRLWMEAFPDCELLNDDNPIICLKDGVLTAYGSPWSGKTPCYRNLSAPVAGIVRLRQADLNRYISKREVEAFMTLLPGCSAIRTDEKLHDELCLTLAEAVRSVRN